MKRLLAFVAAAAVCLVLASPVAADGAVAVPIHGFVGGPDGMSAPDTCPAGAVARYTGTGGGEFSHLGAVDFVITHCTWLDSPTTGHFGPGTVTLTAANSDRLVLADRGTIRDRHGGLRTPFADPARLDGHRRDGTVRPCRGQRDG